MLIERSWRVTMADVDAAGIIYYASPLRWAEVLLGDWLEQTGHSIATMLGGNEAIPVVGPSFRDATRVAGANPPLWAGIYGANRDAVLALCRELAG